MDVIVIATRDEEMRATLQLALDFSFHVIHAKDSAELIDALLEKPVDLVVLDSGLDAERSALELLGQISRIDKETPVIVVSAEPEAESAALKCLGPYEAVVKSFDRAEFRDRVRKTIEHSRSLKELANLREQVRELKITSKLTAPAERAYQSLGAWVPKVHSFESFKKFLEALVNIRDTATLYDMIVEAVTDMFSVNKAALILAEKGANEFSVRASRGLDREFLAQVKPFSVTEGIYSWLWKNDRMLFVEKVAPPELHEIDKEARLLGSKLCVALSFKDRRKPLGYLSLGAKYTGEPYEHAELESIFTLARYAAVAIENASLLEETKEQAIKDELTQLFNRHHWPVRLRIEMERSRRYGRALSVALLDIDYFKKLNDALGVQMGDKILREVAQLLLTSSRTTDVIGRYGGEEFIAVLPETTAEVALAYCERVRTSVEQLGKRESEAIGPTGLTISGGMTSFDPENDTYESLIKRANDALGEAKRQGRNQIRVL